MQEAAGTQHRPGWVALVFVALAAIALWPVKLPLVLGAWFASVARPVMRWLSNLLGGRTSAAALLTVLLLLAIVSYFTCSSPADTFTAYFIPLSASLRRRRESSSDIFSARSRLATM